MYESKANQTSGKPRLILLLITPFHCLFFILSSIHHVMSTSSSGSSVSSTTSNSTQSISRKHSNNPGIRQKFEAEKRKVVVYRQIIRRLTPLERSLHPTLKTTEEKIQRLNGIIHVDNDDKAARLKMREKIVEPQSELKTPLSSGLDSAMENPIKETCNQGEKKAVEVPSIPPNPSNPSNALNPVKFVKKPRLNLHDAERIRTIAFERRSPNLVLYGGIVYSNDRLLYCPEHRPGTRNVPYNSLNHIDGALARLYKKHIALDIDHAKYTDQELFGIILKASFQHGVCFKPRKSIGQVIFTEIDQ